MSALHTLPWWAALPVALLLVAGALFIGFGAKLADGGLG